jgi:hypothetical protein
MEMVNMNNDDELIEQLRSALAAPTVAPDQRTMDGLTRELAALKTVRGGRSTRTGTITSLRRVAGRGVSTLSLVIGAGLLAGGVAAAAVATDTLPGPTRNIAWDLGLPVTSPALYQARQVASHLQVSLHSRDRQSSTSLGRTLVRDLKGLDPSDLAQIQGSADQLLQKAGVSAVTGVTISPPTTLDIDGVLPTIPGAGSSGSNESGESTTTTTTTLLPNVTVPGLNGPLGLGATS